MKAKFTETSVWVWASALAFSGSYVLAMGLERTTLADMAPGVVTTLAVAAAAVLGSRCPKLLYGFLRGAAVGVAAGGAIAMNLLTHVGPDYMVRLAVPMLSTMLFAAGAGLLFAWLGRRRRKA